MQALIVTGEAFSFYPDAKVFETLALAQAASELKEGQLVRTYFSNVQVTADWKYVKGTVPADYYTVPAVGGSLLLMTPSFAAAGITPGAYVPAVAAANRNIMQKLVRDTRFNGFYYGAAGTYYILGSIHPQRDNIKIVHEKGVNLIGRYDDPSVPSTVVGINAGHMWGFVHFVDPDQPVWNDANYAVTAPVLNIEYRLEGTISTEYNSIHSRGHNNNAIGMFRAVNCRVIGTGGITGSDHRGINFDGECDNCEIDIGFATGTSNSPLQMKVSAERYGRVRVGAVYGIKFDGGTTQAVVWCGGGNVDVDVGNYRWNGVVRPVLAYANECQEVNLTCGIISGVSQLVRQYNTPVVRVNGAYVNNTLSIVNKAETEDRAGISKVTEIKGVYAVDTVLTSCFYDETKRAAQDVITIKDNDFRNASPNFKYFEGKTGTGVPRYWNCNSNLDPVGLVDLTDWNPQLGAEQVTTVGASSFSSVITRRWNKLTLQCTESGTNRMLTLDLRSHLSTGGSTSYIVGGTNITVTRSGTGSGITLTCTISSGTINYYVLSC